MRKMLVGGGMLLAVCLFTIGVDTQELRAAPNCPGCEGCFVDKVITEYRQECCQIQVPCVVKKLCYREETRMVPVTVLVPREFIEKCPQTRVIQVPCEQFKDVPRCRKVPVKVCDPVTGCVTIIYKDEWFTERVRYVVMVPQTQTVLVDVKVYRNVPETQLVCKTFVLPEYRDETVMQTKTVCRMVPCQRTIKVPCGSTGGVGNTYPY